MRTVLGGWLLAGALLFAPSGAAAVNGADLEQYVGRSRVLLLFAPHGDDAALARQRAILDEAGDAACARDLVVVPVVGSGAQEARLRARFSAGTGFLAVLVGKDGGAKLATAAPIPAAELFGVIDAMPMRRREAAAGAPTCRGQRTH